MPLPFSPKPEESRVYDSLKSTRLDEVTADQVETLRSQVFAQGIDGAEDEYRRLVLLAAASLAGSMSGPIPGTQQIVQTTYTSTGDDADFFKPTSGVWLLVGGDTVSSGGTGSIQWTLKDADGTLALIFQTSVNGQEPIMQNSNNNNLPSPIYITPENWLYANVSAVATNVRASISFIRVR